MLTDITRVTVLRPAFLSRDPPCPISNQALPGKGSANPLGRSAGRRPGANQRQRPRAGSATGAPLKRVCRIYTGQELQSSLQATVAGRLALCPGATRIRHRTYAQDHLASRLARSASDRLLIEAMLKPCLYPLSELMRRRAQLRLCLRSRPSGSGSSSAAVCRLETKAVRWDYVAAMNRSERTET